MLVKQYHKLPVVIEAYQTAERVEIETLEGTMVAEAGDYIITGIKGERYPCKPDIFEASYIEVGLYGENNPRVEELDAVGVPFPSLGTPLTDQEHVRLEKDFTYHPPKGDQAQRYGVLRSAAKAFAREVMDMTPASREQSLALTKIEEAVFWANAAIARNE